MPAPPEELAVTLRHESSSSFPAITRLLSDFVPHLHSIYPGIDPKPHYNAQTFHSKTVFIAGVSKGIGEEIASTYARARTSVVLVTRNQAKLDSAEASIICECPKVAVLTIIADV